MQEGDSGEEEGEERSEGDGDEELEEVLLFWTDGTTTTTSSSSSSGTLLLHSSSCWDSNSVTSFPDRNKEIFCFNKTVEIVCIEKKKVNTNKML